MNYNRNHSYKIRFCYFICLKNNLFSFENIAAMQEKIIPHPLRNIVLNYDESKPETDYEKSLLQAYLKIHDDTLPVLQMHNKLKYEYMEHSDHIVAAEKQFEPIAKQLYDFFLEANAITKNRANKKSIEDIQERMSSFHEEFIVDFHENILTAQLVQESKTIEQAYDLFCTADEKLSADFEFYHDTTANDLYKNYDNYSLDLVAYDEDEQGLRGELDKMFHFNKFRNEVIDRYNNLMETINIAYTQWDETKRLISEFYDDSGMMESSISEHYAQHPDLKDDKRPNYIISPSNKLVSRFRNDMGLLAHSGHHTLNLQVPIQNALNGDVAQVQEHVLCLQHFPKLLEKFLFGFQIVFLNRDNIAMKDDEWKGVKEAMQWFVKLNEFPIMLFFLKDSDARAYCLFGDLIEQRDKEASDENMVAFGGEQVQILCDRLFQCCWMMLMFCHNTGFDPEPYIEAVLADYDLSFTYQQVKEKYEADVKAGIQFRVLKKGEELNDGEIPLG